MGVPMGAVAQKMRTAGLDPALIMTVEGGGDAANAAKKSKVRAGT